MKADSNSRISRNVTLLATLLTSGLCLPLTAAAAAQAVVVYGIQKEFSEKRDFPGFAGGQFTLEQLCAVDDQIAGALQSILARVNGPMVVPGQPNLSLSDIENLPGAPNRAEIENALRNAADTLCNEREEPPSIYPFVITYAHCRMAMVTPIHAMDIHLPPGVGAGTMSMADHTTRETMQLSLKRNIDAVSEYTGSGWSGQIDINPTGATGERIGYATRQYNFEYKSGLGVPGLGAATGTDIQTGAISSPQALGNLVSVTNKGTAWISDSAPGIDIVRSFYEKLTREVQTDQGASSFFGGLINNLVGMLNKGIPLEIDQTVSSAIMGRSTFSGRSTAVVLGISLRDYQPEWCTQSLMPAGYAVTDIDQQISDATSGTSGAGTPPSAEIARGMQGLNEAMQQLTPEQREMMEKFGLGGNQQLPAMNPAVQSAGAGAATSTMPPSEELYSDNLTQMVQNHLQALGYTPGNTSGDSTIDTVIAISQFQAEQGIEVTGEISPQLAGRLSAEVDRRRGN